MWLLAGGHTLSVCSLSWLTTCTASMPTLLAAAGDKEAEAAALEVCREAEITAILLDNEHAPPPIYLDSTPKSFLRWKRDPQAEAMAAGAAAAASSASEEGSGTATE
eukprot:GHRR01010923.1.p2 GENE.GHRR01010923.1~~GHRR01010923.1.p2  ORF type:complete len:107 (+),score=47.83 GHRR01010923.1:287-607(+)